MCARASQSNHPGLLTSSREVASQTFSDLPPIVSAATAIQRLRTVRFTPARQAVAQLAVWQESSRILQLYRRYFPQEFARSSASTVVPIHHGEPGYSEREREFFRLVDAHLFPLCDLDGERLSSIPICPMGIDWGDPPEEYCLAIGAVMGLLTDGENFPSGWVPSNLRVQAGELDWDTFTQLCKDKRGAMREFPLILEWVTQGTGNVWLDTPVYNDWEPYSWDEATLNLLAREWQRACDLIARINRALEQINAHPRYYLTWLVRLWNRAVRSQGTEIREVE